MAGAGRVHHVVTAARVEAAEVGAVLAPRSDMVLEREIGPGRFEAADGPVETYRRQVVVEPAEGGRSQVRQTVEFRLAVPWVSWLFLLPARRHLGSLLRPPRPPWWLPPCRLDPRTARALTALAALALVDGYLGTVLTQTGTFAAREFGASDRALGLALAVVRADVALAFVLVALADRRGWLLAGSRFLLNLFLVPATQYQNQFLRAERGFSGARISLFLLGTNTPGGIGVVAGGRLADVRGRRIVAGAGLIGGVGATVAMYSTSGWPMWSAAVAAAVIGAAVLPALGVYGPELFPTSLRGRANGLLYVSDRLGGASGLLTVGFLAWPLGALGRPLALLALGPLALSVIVLTVFPETAGVELETLNPEDAGDGSPREGEADE